MVKKKPPKKTAPKPMTANQEQRQQEHFAAMASILLEGSLSGRANILSRLGKSYGGDRDVYEALGYPTVIGFNDYAARYERQDIAARIIEARPDPTRRKPPEIVENEKEETAFEKAWNDLVKNESVYHYLNRVDILSGIGQYGVLLIGLNDKEKELSKEAKSATKITYLRPFSEVNAIVNRYETNPKNERYGLPKTYDLNFANAERNKALPSKAHHSRIIHVAENLREDSVYGTPRLKNVFNRLMNLELISGGSAEMFWRGALPGIMFGLDPDANAASINTTDITTEIEEYMHGLKRYLKLQGIKAEQLTVQVADPSKHVLIQIQLIAAAKGYPMRILLGSERGELASSQDERAWNDKIDERRKNYAEPTILRPFIDKLIGFGVLPEPKEEYTVVWPDLQLPSEKEVADVAKTKAEALRAYLASPEASLLLPFEIFLSKFLNLNKEEVDEIITLGEDNEKEIDEEEGAETAKQGDEDAAAEETD